VAYNVPVDVGGVYVQPGDLIAADLHGAILIPIDAAERLPAAAEALANQEDVILALHSLETLQSRLWPKRGRNQPDEVPSPATSKYLAN
jgi:regulator of RNase E activity RraA